MNCNCNNNGNTALRQPIITHVQGNVLRVAIPLTLRTVELVDVDVDGETQQQAVATDTDFYPSDKQPVRVVFSKGATSMPITATMNGNVAYVEERGKIPVGTYEMTVTCADDNGNNYRFNQNAVLKVVHSTAEAGITTPIEYEVKTWYLDAAIFLAMKGEDGVGIEDITTETSGEIGGLNTVTITMTDGRIRTFTVMNGSGSVDEELDPNSRHPISNAAVTGKFSQIESELESVFGDVGYNSRSSVINFYAKGKPKTDENILATLDARPFVKDGMVNNVYISNNTLVITFNTDSGKMPIGVPLSSIFNPNNYYTRAQIVNLLDDYYTKAQVDNKIAQIDVDTSGLAQLDQTTNRVKYSQNASNVLGFIEDIGVPGEEGYGVLFARRNGHIYMVNEMEQYIDLGYAGSMVFYDKNTDAWYRYENNEWVTSGGSSGGYNVSFDNGNVIFSGSNQPTFNNGNITF